jgi:hypothetical protein
MGMQEETSEKEGSRELRASIVRYKTLSHWTVSVRLRGD